MLAKTAQLLVRKRWLRSALLLITALVGLYLLVPLCLNRLASQLIRRDALQSADVVIALSGDARCQREKYAAELYRQGRARKILVGGFGVAWGMHTGEAAQRFLVNEGIPAADVLVLNDTWNTRVEAGLLVQQMRQHGWTSALVVTDLFHSRRALYTIEAVARDCQFYSQPLPEAYSRWRPERWWTRRGDVWVTLREGLSWINTWVGGWQ